MDTTYLKSVFSEAFVLIRGQKRYFWGYLLLMMVIPFILNRIITPELLRMAVSPPPPGSDIPVVDIPILIPVMIGLSVFIYTFFLLYISATYLLGANIALRRPGSLKDSLKRTFKHFIPLFFFSLLLTIIPGLITIPIPSNTLGTVVQVVLGLLISPFHIYTILICIDRDISVTSAFKLAYHNVLANAGRIYPMVIILMLTIGLGGLFTLGIGLIWLIPWGAVVWGIMYRDIFYTTREAVAPPMPRLE